MPGCSRVVLAVVVLAVLGVAVPAAAEVTVSTSDGMSLALTNAGAFSSLSVDGQAVPLLDGVLGGFFIIPMEGVAIGYDRHTFYPGTRVAGTATQSGADVHVSGTAGNQFFDIWLRGGSPYLKVDGTVTGDGDDHAFLVDFRLPVDANGWTWANRVNDVVVINTSSTSNWYFANDHFHWSRHPDLSINPYGTITRHGSGSGTTDVGLSISPLFYPPCAYAIEYNAQTGLFIEFELGTTAKTTKHPNTADFHFVLYRHDPKWGNRSAVQRYQSFFPRWFMRTVSGGNWFIDPSPRTHLPTTPEDFGLKFSETCGWDDAYSDAHGMITVRYVEPWGWHIWAIEPAGIEAEAVDIPSNWSGTCHCPGNRGMSSIECAQAALNGVDMNPDGTLIGPDELDLWTDYSSTWRWIMNPDPELTNWRQFTPGTTRVGNAEFREWYDNWGTPPSTPANHFSGMYHDSLGGYWCGWDLVHNFNPAHWPYYDYSPGINWGSTGAFNHGYANGVPTMWAPFSNVEYLKFCYEQMRREGRVVYANMGPAFENAMAAPFLEAWGVEAGVAETPITNQALMRMIAGPKPLSFLYPAHDGGGGGHPASEVEMKAILPFGIYPGGGAPDMTDPAKAAEYTSLRPLYQQYMPIFNTLDAAGWHPITAAAPADPTQILERFGPNASGEIFYVLRAVSSGTATVTVSSADLGWSSSPSVAVTALLGAAPSTSFDGSGNLVLSFGAISALDDRVVKLVYSGTPTVPIANFSGTPTSGDAPLPVTFTDTSSHTPTTWYWDFGDGAISTVQNPSHTYTAGGKHIVSLTARNASGQDTETKDNYITVAAPPVASFDFYRTWGVVGAETTAEFKDTSTNTPTSWSWTFGDGGVSTVQNPYHTYSAVGLYTVALTATNTSGSGTCTKAGLVHILGIKAEFKADTTFGTVPLTVNFTDESTGTPTTWSWTFGDGGASTVQNPSHTYVATGYYTVMLTVQGLHGSNTTIKSSYITACGEVIVYPTSYSMDVPGGGNGHVTSGTLNDLHTADGVCMAFTSDTTDTAHYFCEVRYVSATGYTADQLVGAMVEYRAKADGPVETCAKPSWNCPACPIHPFPGVLTTYTYSREAARALDESGNAVMTVCSYPMVTKVPINISVDMVRWHLYLKPGGGTPTPVAAFTGTPTIGVAPQAVNFTDASTNSPTAWAWNFGDFTISTARHPSHTYAAPGVYTVALTATNSGGSNTTTRVNYVTVVGAGSAPVAGFSGVPASGGPLPLTVTFTDTSVPAPTSWSWSFGDGGVSTVQSPSHAYASAGSYTVALTAANAGGADTCTKLNYVKAATFPDVLPDGWAWPYVEACVTDGVVGGYPDGTYQPGVVVNRGQMAGFIARAMVGGDSHLPTPPAVAHFPDVPTGHWAYRYVEYAYADNIVSGYPGGNYEPDWNVDRGQMAGFIARGIVTPPGDAGLTGYVPPTTASFPDVPTSFWTYKYIEYLREQGVVGGYPDGWYHPEIVVTREQMAVFIARAFGLPM